MLTGESALRPINRERRPSSSLRSMSPLARITAPLAYRLSPRSVYVDVHTHSNQTILLVGSRRSELRGSARSSTRTTRIGRSSSPSILHIRTGRGDSHPKSAKFMSRVRGRVTRPQVHGALVGAARDPWIDKHNTRRIATRRLIKCVETTNLSVDSTAMARAQIVTWFDIRSRRRSLEIHVAFHDDGLTDLQVLTDRPRLVDGVCGTLQDDTLARAVLVSTTDPFEQHVASGASRIAFP